MSFQANRTLLNPKFEGYKLSPISQEDAISHHPLQYIPSQSNISGRNPLSFQEVQSRILHNHLTISPDGRAVYVDAELRVVLVVLDDVGRNVDFRILYELPRPIQSPNTDTSVLQREYPSTAFVDASTLLVADGYEHLYALRVPAQSSDPTTLLGIFHLEIPPVFGSSLSSVPFKIQRASQVTDQTAVVLLSSKHYRNAEQMQVDDTPSRGKPPSPDFDVWAIQLDISELAPQQTQSQAMNILWHRHGKDVPLYTTYDATRKAVLLVGGSTFSPMNIAPPSTYEPSADELAPIPRANEQLDGDQIMSTQTHPEKPPPYSWTQTSDSVTIAIPLPSSTPAQDIKVAFSARTLTVLVQGSSAEAQQSPIPLPRYTLKTLWDGIQHSTSLWTFDRSAEHSYGILSLHLDKQHEGTRWPQVFAPKENTAGQDQEDDVEVPETLDPTELYNIREALEKYTAALRSEDPSGLNLGHGIPSLAEGEMDDELDSEVGHSVCLTWVPLSGETAPNHKDDPAPANLLSTPLPGLYPEAPLPSLIIKNGIDGAVYELEPAARVDDPPRWTHRATFSALSFVLASKQDTRFVHHISTEAVFAFESGARELGGNVYIYRGTGVHEQWAKQAVLKIGGGQGGALLGVGIIRRSNGTTAILCLCEGELIVMHDVL